MNFLKQSVFDCFNEQNLVFLGLKYENIFEHY